MKLSVKITSVVTGIIIAICALLTYVSYVFASKTIISEVEQNMLKYAKEAATRTELIINSNLSTLNELATRARTRSMDWEIQRKSLMPDIKRLGYLDMAIVTKDGMATYVSNESQIYLGDREYIKKAFERQSNVSDVIISRVTNTAVVMYAVPIIIEDKVEGVLIARADGAYFNAITDDLIIGEGGYSFIIGANTVFFAHPDRDLVLSRINVYEELNKNNPKYTGFGNALKEVGIRKSDILKYTYMGKERIMASAPINSTDWTLFVGNQKDSILKGVYKLKNISIGISIVFSLVGMVVALVLSLSIANPIKNISSKLNISAKQVKSASNELSNSSQQMAAASSEQASSIEETSSTLDETSAMVQQNSVNTQKAKQLTHKTKEAVVKGNQEMTEMTSAMLDMKNSSDEISKIAKVIESIAFQTNILALNAAVEAARAGDAGLGFAVVAEEVSNLAGKTSAAVKETTDMVNSNIKKTVKGVELSEKVMESLKEINVDVDKLDKLMEEVESASNEQSQGILQINKALNQMGEVVQETAANSEESAASAEELSAQSESMEEIVIELLKIVDGK